MSVSNSIILLLEDCPVTALLVERVILQELPTARLIWARTVAEAQARSEGIPVCLFLVDIVLPDGSGLDFLNHASATHPTACAIVITATKLPEHRVMSAALGAIDFIEKPLKIPVVLEQIRGALESRSVDGASRDFQATLENVTPMDILQLKCLSAASTVVEFRFNFRKGSIRFQKGEVVDAVTDSLRGIDAVREIICWPHGHVFEHAETGEFERTIHCSWQALLMEAAQEFDEHRSQTAVA